MAIFAKMLSEPKGNIRRCRRPRPKCRITVVPTGTVSVLGAPKTKLSIFTAAFASRNFFRAPWE